MRRLARTLSPLDPALAAFAWLALAVCFAGAAETPPDPTPAAPAEEQPEPPSADQDNAPREKPARDDAAERAAVWNSPEMAAARQWLVAYFRQTDQYTPAQQQAYAERLSDLSAEEMRAWLIEIGELQRRLAARNQKLAAHHQWRQARESAQQFQQAQIAERAAREQQLRARRAYGYYSQPYRYGPRGDSAGLNYRATTRERFFYDRYGPLESLLLLNYLDVQDIRDDLRALRAQSGD